MPASETGTQIAVTQSGSCCLQPLTRHAARCLLLLDAGSCTRSERMWLGTSMLARHQTIVQVAALMNKLRVNLSNYINARGFLSACLDCAGLLEQEISHASDGKDQWFPQRQGGFECGARLTHYRYVPLRMVIAVSLPSQHVDLPAFQPSPSFA